MKPIIVAVVALLADVGRVMAADMPVPQAAPVPPLVYFPASTIGAAFISAPTAATVLVKATGPSALPCGPNCPARWNARL